MCAVSFAVLTFLRVLNFLAFLRESSRICGGRMRRLFGIISLLIFVLGPIIYFVLFDESNQADISWIQLTIFYALIFAGVIYVFSALKAIRAAGISPCAICTSPRSFRATE